MPDDREEWRNISNRDAATFHAFYVENAPRLRRFLRQILGSVHAAEDVVQDTFTQLWKKPVGFDPDRGSLRAYLFGIGRKGAANWWRQQKPSEDLNEQTTGSCRIEMYSAVNDAFARLPEDQRALLWLREVEGLSYAEIASALEIPIGTVRSRLFSAREALRDVWHNQPEHAKGAPK